MFNTNFGLPEVTGPENGQVTELHIREMIKFYRLSHFIHGF